MTTIFQELEKKGLKQEESELLVKKCSEAGIKTEEELYDYIKTLDTKYSNIIEIYLRYEKMIPFQKLTTQQAYLLFLLIKKNMKQKERQIIENFFRSSKGTKVDLKNLSQILVGCMNSNNKITMECTSILYYIYNEISGQTNEEIADLKININTIYELLDRENE